MRNDLKALGVGLLTTVALSAAVAAAQQERAPWALGMSPTFSGRIPNWAQGDAMTPGEGVISVLYDPGDGQELEIAQGIVRSNGDFDLSLRPAGAVPGGGRRPLDALCEDAEMVNVTVSNPDQLVVPVRLDVTELYEEGRHARPEGSVMVREGPPTAAFLVDRYAFIYAGAYDPVGGTLLCSAITWSVAAPDVLSGGGCEATVTFKSQGPRQVVVTATNTYGTSTTEVITLTVGPEPEDKPPVITSFHIRAAEGPQRLGEGPADIYACPTGYYCEVPPDAVLWNGQARYLEDYVGPLYLEVEATDDNGAPLTVTWTCSAGGSSAPVPYEGEGVYSCNPFFPGQTIVVSVSVSDGKSAATASRSFFMRSTVN